jgi:hypothetical protein
MKYYKVLDKHGCSCHGGDAEWSLPTQNDDGTWTPGEWMPEIEGELKPCRNGYHVVTLEQLLDWLGERIFEVEPGDEIVHEDNKSVTRTCRLTRECTGWNERTARLFACDCAERVLPLYEAYYDDDSPRKAIEVARRYADGKAAVEELTAAWEAAWEAALNASRDAGWAAAWAATEDAARAAAWAAAWAAARDASREASRAASRYAAWAAQEAAEDDARAAALNAERQWQVERLRKILEVASDDANQ